MRNTSNELIDSARALLRDIVLPEVKSDLARARLRQILATLRDVDWDEAPLAAMRENTVLQGLLASWGTQPDAAAGAGVPRFHEIVGRNTALRRQLAEAFAASPAQGWTDAHAQAARVLADCARARGEKRRAAGS